VEETTAFIVILSSSFRELGQASTPICSATTPPLHQYAFMAWCLVKHRDNFTFTFTILVVHYTTLSHLGLVWNWNSYGAVLPVLSHE